MPMSCGAHISEGGLWLTLRCGLAIWLLLCGRTAAQNFAPPQGWSNSTSSLDRTSREDIARGAASTVVPLIDPSQGTVNGFDGLLSASLVAVLAKQDYLNKDTAYRVTVENNLQIYGQQHQGYFFFGPQRVNSDPIYWGLAAYYAYRAYNDQSLLDLAASLWNETVPAFITADQAVSFTQPSRNVSIKPSCTTSSIAGGVFWMKDVQNDTQVNGETVGPFMALSAYLYESTKNTQFLTAAQLSADFMQLHMFNASYIYDTFDVRSCSINIQTFRTYNSAFFVEGLGVLANVTNNATQTQLLMNFIPSLVQFSGWNLPSGVISEELVAANSSASTLKAILVRGLAELHDRNPGTPLASLIESYITVQFNSILSFARAGNSNNYTTAWTGPAPTDFNPAGNVAALDVFNAMVSFAPPSPNTTTTSQSHQTSAASSSSSSHAGAIAGGVIGGVAAVAAILGAVLFFLHRRRQRELADQPRQIGLDSEQGMQERRGEGLVVEPYFAEPEIPQPVQMFAAENGSPGYSNAKLLRMNQPYHAGPSVSEGSQSFSPPSSTNGSSVPSDPRTGLLPSPTAGPAPRSQATSASAAEELDVSQAIPNLVNRLNGLLRMTEMQRQLEQPPQYDDNVGEPR